MRLALDASKRHYDQNGHLIVDETVITKAAVNTYLGEEIPEYEALGLEPKREYRLLRDPKELSKAMHTFDGVQLLLKHIPVNADEPQTMFTIGSVGLNGIKMRGFNVYAGLRVFDQKGIDLIEARKLPELSAGYGYRADMTSGTFNGVYYDGVMRDIFANHVAIVARGRIGRDAIIADELPLLLEKRMSVKRGTINRITALINRGIALDGEATSELARDILRIAQDEEDRKARDRKARDACDADDEDDDDDDDLSVDRKARDKKARDKHARDRRARDAHDDDDDDDDDRDARYDDRLERARKREDDERSEIDDYREKERGAKDRKAKDRKAKDRKAHDARDRRARDAHDDDDDDDDRDARYDDRLERARKREDDERSEIDDYREKERGAKDRKAKDRKARDAKAMDADLIRQQAVNDVTELFRAREKVRPLVGLIACDSASEVYAETLREAGLTPSSIHPSAYETMVDLLLKQQRHTPAISQDSDFGKNDDPLTARFK